MADSTSLRTPLHTYVEHDETLYALYEAYEPQSELLRRIARLLPHGHVVIPSRTTCKDCIRNVPKMARIAEHLPGWTWDIYNHNEQRERSNHLGVVAIPTFILYSQPEGDELGRIIENPKSDSLEQDLLTIIERQWD